MASTEEHLTVAPIVGPDDPRRFTDSGIEIGERVAIPDALVPADARVEIEAKIAAGYYSGSAAPSAADLAVAKGRRLTD